MTITVRQKVTEKNDILMLAFWSITANGICINLEADGTENITYDRRTFEA